MSNLLTIGQLAERLNCTDRHIRNLVKRGVLSSLKLGGSRRFNPETVEREIEALTVTSQTLASASHKHPRSTNKRAAAPA